LAFGSLFHLVGTVAQVGVRQLTRTRAAGAGGAESFTDLDVDVRQSVERIRNSPYIPVKDSIRGFVFDVATGKLNEVV